MRRSAIVFTVAAMMILPEAMAYAQSRATYSACEALSVRRGSGPEAGNRTHKQFMRDCLAGTVAFAASRTPAPALEAHMQSYEKCEDLSVERGSGPESGNRNHRSFMRQCMAGRIR